MTTNLKATANVPVEWTYTSGRQYADPFNDVRLDAVVTDPDGNEQRVPAFWAGGQNWGVRYATPRPGTYGVRTECSDADNPDLQDRRLTLEVGPCEGDNPLFARGGLRVSEDRRHLEHADGTPFFWLGDTWWMGLCRRLRWPDEFRTLTADRVQKGFSVIQIVAGLYPDMPPFDERGDNEGGWPWEQDYARINPTYFDMADLRLFHLAQSGLVPCIVGCWGFYLKWLGVEGMKRHWRYLIARYGALPVVWCLAGEATMPWYLSEEKDADRDLQKRGWSELARYVRDVDPYGRPVTIHPTRRGAEQVENPSLLDFEMLQTGHGGYESIPNTVETMRSAMEDEPRMPVLNAEVCYEGILEGSREEIQRFMFWSCMLSGAFGHTYGAQGIWGVNRPGRPFGPSPWGSSWGDRPWQEAAALPGSTHMGVGRRILERWKWWRFEPHQEWVRPAGGEEDYRAAYAAGIPGEVRVFYFPRPILPWGFSPVVRGLAPGARYDVLFIDPKDGSEHRLEPAEADAGGEWPVARPPVAQDWVLCLERLS